MSKLTSLLLIPALILSFFPLSALAQQLSADPSVVKIKTDIARRLRDEKTTVTVRLRNGSEVKGRITEAAENMFTVKEKKNGTRRDISYADVMKVNGRSLSKGAKFGIITGIVAGAFIIGALISLRNFDPFKNGVLR